MAHYAIIDENNIVINVVTGINETDTSQNWEEFYGNFHTNLLSQNVYCKRTSYNTAANEHKFGGTPFRKNYAGIGYEYNLELDAFIVPQPFDSWSLNEETCFWQPPTPYPTDGQEYQWNEETQTWDLITE